MLTHAAPAVLLHVDPTEGCTAPACGTQATVQLSPYAGRRCPDHATLPAGRFDRDLAADMVSLGRADAAFAYLRGWLARETSERFDAADDRVAVPR